MRRRVSADAPCARCHAAPRVAGNVYCLSCCAEAVRARYEYRVKRKAAAERFEELVAWCEKENIKEIAGRLAK